MARQEHAAFLTLAAKTALKGARQGKGGPFGAIIVRKNKAIAAAHNTVLASNDATRHAEMNAITIASRKLKNFSLAGCDVYSTTEPCPMCFSALHWARVKTVYYCTTIADVKKLGFNELTVSNLKLKKWGKSPVRIKRLDNDACKELLKSWKKMTVKKTY